MTNHIPVLLQEVIKGLSIGEGEVVLDGTVGEGGHSKFLCRQIGENGTLVGVDLDKTALQHTKKVLSGCVCRVELVEENFKNMDIVLQKLKLNFVDKIILDLGMRNFHIKTSKKGFSFLADEPLIMTFGDSDKEGVLTATEILNNWSEETIADILYGFGEEKHSRRIASKIVSVRQDTTIKRTKQLVEIIEQSTPKWYRYKKTHPATKTFQALRIAVNDETNALQEGLSKGFDLLSPNGRIAVITFHSIEDRIVKQFFREKVLLGEADFINKRPIIAKREEVLINRKARSAKLRIIIKK